MSVDLYIRGGLVIDPARGLRERGDIAVKNGRIVDFDREAKIEREINAEGCLVIPGLVDFHAHVYNPGCDFSVQADPSFLPQGVTTMLDAGSAGVCNYDNFVRTAAAFSQMRIFSLINVSPAGMPTLRYHEETNPKYYDAGALQELKARYPDRIIGLKCRQSKNVVGDLGLEPLKETVKIADKIGLPVVVHVTDPPCTMDKLADILRPGDVLCHCYNGTGNTILGDDGKVLPGIKAAQKRGVIFDAANGKFHFSIDVARQAISEGFLPDVISSDLTVMTLYMDYVFGLPYVLSKYLSLGVDMMDVFSACTSTPAALLGMRGKLGTLTPGAVADVAVFRLIERPTRHLDTSGKIFVGNQLLVPQMTVLGGKIVYRHIEFDTGVI